MGDSEVDIVTGRAAGVKSVGVEWGFRDRKTLEAAGAEHIITTPDQLLQFVS
nr:HAD hydrolase-like protein [Dorea sp. AM58-8]